MRKKLFVLLLLTLVTTSAFADGVIGSGGRTEEEERAIIGSGGRSSIFGSGGLQQRVSAAFTRLFELAEERGYFGSGN